MHPRRLAVLTRPLGALGVPGWFPLVVEPLHRRLGRTCERVQLRVGGATMDLDLTEYVQRRIFYGSYEPNEARLLRRFLRPGDAVLDVGANVGFFTLLASQAVGPSGRVVAVEPVPANATALERNLRLNDVTNVRVERVAVDSQPGVLHLGLSPDLAGDGERGRDATSGHYTAGGTDLSHEVPAVMLDDVADAVGRRLRLVKVDVEGLEERALAGFRRTLAELPPDALMLEANAASFAMHAASDVRIRQQLETAGYRLRRIGVGGRLVPLAARAGLTRPGRVDNLFAVRPGVDLSTRP